MKLNTLTLGQAKEYSFNCEILWRNKKVYGLVEHQRRYIILRPSG